MAADLDSFEPWVMPVYAEHSFELLLL